MKTFEAVADSQRVCKTETDEIFPAPKRHESEAILNKMNVPWQINLFSGVVHGFAVRCDLSNRPQKFAKEQAFFQAVTWFDQYLKPDEDSLAA